jgi:peptidoglycan/LPS O-acetylase OafA/YrhL
MEEIERETGKSMHNQQRVDWLDSLRVIALLWILLNHISEQLFGFPYIANPTFDWPTLVDRIRQLFPLTDYGVLNIPMNLLRYVGWFGDQGVQLFLIISGFGITWGFLIKQKNRPINLHAFWSRRFGRILPLWWGVHLVFLMMGLLTGWGVSPTDRAFYLSLFGIRFTSATFYYLAPAWWFIGLLLQLYLIYPLLWEGLRRVGPGKLLVVCSVLGFASRAVGLIYFQTYVDPWQRGAFFVTRLPEFAFGISLAYWMSTRPQQVQKVLRNPRTIFLAAVVYVLGLFLSLFKLGMIFAPFIVGVAVFLLLYSALHAVKGPRRFWQRAVRWISNHTYSIYLVQHPILLILLPVGLSIHISLWLRLALAFGLILLSALVLDTVVDKVLSTLSSWRESIGLPRTISRTGGIIAAIAVVLLGAELGVRVFAPQEVLGWGERNSLEPHTTYGWRLKPSSSFQLRWQDYDYRIYTNALGFQGPAYAKEKSPDRLRIMVIGDAFTSAEGVDTDAAWPRLLVEDLEAFIPGEHVEVFNFAVTGYGPNQYAAVLKEYVPVYRPDIILIGFFVNDFEDVLISDDQFRASIGFGNSDPEGIYSIFSLQHLKRFIRLQMLGPVEEFVRREPNELGYFLGNFAQFERDREEEMLYGRHLVEERMVQVTELADRFSARLLLIEIPASIQVCSAEDLAYFPKYIDLEDETRFDLNRPQQMISEIAVEYSIMTLDLAPVLQVAPNGCVYQQHNMHWTEEGHQIAAAEVAAYLISQPSFIPASHAQ